MCQSVFTMRCLLLTCHSLGLDPSSKDLTPVTYIHLLNLAVPGDGRCRGALVPKDTQPIMGGGLLMLCRNQRVSAPLSLPSCWVCKSVISLLVHFIACAWL